MWRCRSSCPLILARPSPPRQPSCSQPPSPAPLTSVRWPDSNAQVPVQTENCVTVTVGPTQATGQVANSSLPYVYYCRTYEKAVSGGREREKGGHVLRDTTSRGVGSSPVGVYLLIVTVSYQRLRESRWACPFDLSSNSLLGALGVAIQSTTRKKLCRGVCTHRHMHTQAYDTRAAGAAAT